ncbi:MAG: Holliday junction DNA helicase RuvA [Planctomycetes bacterium]|nr:Holliday junction DNA helicase RuvA [Planctomycetota bacterium]
MRTRITGKLIAVEEDHAVIEAGPFEYEVLVPDFVRSRLQGRLNEDVRLHTIEYIEGNAAGGRMTPRLVGFLSVVEREFFEMFCSVDGVGVKKALRAMVRPVRDVAVQIEQQDTKGLSALPGVGPATAERVVAKLRRKMSRFALLVSSHDEPSRQDVPRDLVQMTFEALLTLGHSEADARRMIDAALDTKEKFKEVEDLLRAIYRNTFERSAS